MKKLQLIACSCLAFLFLNTVQAANFKLQQLWHAPPLTTYPYATTNNFQRGMAFNPATGHLLVVERSSETIYIISADDGSVLGTLDMSNLVLGGNTSFKINLIAVAEDGAIYVGNLSNSTTSPAYNLYRWENESAPQTPMFFGDPGSGNVQRWGDTMTVRGSGTNTMILLGTRGSYAAVFRPTDATLTAFTPTMLALDTPVGSSGFSVAFGEGNTFWTASGVTSQLVPPPGDPIRVFSFDLNSGTATQTAQFGLPPLPAGMAVITLDATNKLMAGIAIGTPDKVNLYSVTDLSNVPVLYDSATVPTDYDNPQYAGAIQIVSNKIYALDQNNGLLAYSIISTNDAVPQFVGQPASVTLNTNETATFSAAVQGSTPMFYQWKKGVTAIPGATNSVLTISNVSASAAGNYTLVASNSVSLATSSNAVLVVNGDSTSDAGLLLSYEPFNYTTGQNLTGLVAPSGQTWALNGSGDQTQVAPGNLSYSGLQTPNGNSVTNGGAGAAARLPLGTNITAGSLYYSFLMRVDDVGASFTAVNSFLAAFYGTTPNSYALRLVPKAVTGGYQLAVGRTGASTNFSPTVYTAGQTLFIVGSYTFGPTTGDDVVNLWINPDSTTFGAATAPAATLTDSGAGSDIAVMDTFTFRQNTAGNTPAAITYDELRVGTSWSAVTPIAAAIPPTLSITRSDNDVVVSWPTADSSGFNLQQTTSLSNPAWSSVGTPVVIQGSNNTVTIQPDSQSRFFRLFK